MHRSWNISRAPYDEGLRTMKTTIQRIFSYIFPEADERTPFRFPEFQMFNTFLNVGFISFIIPFRISKNAEGHFHITSFIIQQLLSTLAVLCACVHSFWAIRLLLTKDLKSNPSDSFAVIYSMIKHCLPFAWFYTFWMKRESFAKLLMVCQAKYSSPSMYLARIISTPFVNPSSLEHGTDPNKFIPIPRLSAEWRVALVCRIATYVGAVKMFYETWKVYREMNSNEEFLWRVLGYNAGASLQNFQLEKNLLIFNKSDLEHWIETGAYINLTLMSTGILYGVAYDSIGNLAEVFCLVGACIIYSICERFSREIPKIKEDKDGNSTNPLFVEEHNREDNKPSRLLHVLEKMSVDFMELNTVEEAANSIFGPVFLIYILAAFPSLAGCMMFKQPNSITGIKLTWFAVMYSVTMHALVTMIASEGSSMIRGYKCWLFDVSLLRTKRKTGNVPLGLAPPEMSPSALSNAVLSRLNHLHREVASGAVGLKGCGFFSMSHGLIGTILGIFVTFAIVIVQFEMDQKPKN